MSEQINLNKIQRRTTRLLAFEDGLWDLLVGGIFMLLALYPYTRELLGPVKNVALFITVMLIFVALQLVVRSRISIPRIGYAETHRTPALKIALAVTIGLVMVTFTLVLLTLFGGGPTAAVQTPVEKTWLQRYSVDIIAMLAMAGVFSLLGFLFAVPRIYFYGWMLGGANFFAQMFDLNDGVFNYPLGIASGIILLIGAILLRRFFRRYPIPAQEGLS